MNVKFPETLVSDYNRKRSLLVEHDARKPGFCHEFIEASYLRVDQWNDAPDGFSELWHLGVTPGVNYPDTGGSNPGTEPWTLAGAALVDSTGTEVELARWQEAPIPANGACAVVVGIAGERARLGCPCTLKLWEAQGPRTVTLGNVTFPVSQKAAS
jgi:hypothetical protein